MYWPLGAPRSYVQQLPLELSLSDPDDNVTTFDETPKASVDESTAIEQNAVNDDNIAQDRVRSDEQGTGALDAAHSRERVDDGNILCLRASRHGHVFATITSSSLTVWQTQPPVVIASLVRSAKSMGSYGPNTNLLLRPEGDLLVLHTSLGYLITYSLSIHPEHRPYDLIIRNNERRRRSSMDARTYATRYPEPLFNGGGLCSDASLRFRMVIKVDAGITIAVALDAELVVATKKPAAIQCIQWQSGSAGTRATSDLLEHMDWLEEGTTFVEIVYDRPMNLFTFITSSGEAYAVQKSPRSKEHGKHTSSFRGHRFHSAKSSDDKASKVAVNSRFSIIAIGCADGSVALYSVRDYAGGVSLLCKVQPSLSRNSTGPITVLSYSPDGYCLFVGYEHGWATWSVYGQPGGSSFMANAQYTELNDDTWLDGVVDAFWTGSGTDLVLLDASGERIWMLEFARSAMAGCFAPANIARTTLQTSSGFMVYKGYQTPDLLTIATDISLWQFIKAPAGYLNEQGPIRAIIMSADGRYLAIAGQRGLAHYSFQSGRWRTFDDTTEQNSFAVRGGMCWYHHVLIVATETADGHEIRLYSRESALSHSKTLHIERLAAAAIHLAPSGEDSILVYTNDNVLDHYIVAASNNTVGLVKVGQIALHGIIRAPPRVRAVSWVVPEHQLKSGEPSHDVAVASVFFLVDGKLVLLQPSSTDDGELKYDMRVIAQHVEYYMLARDSLEANNNNNNSQGALETLAEEQDATRTDHNLGDSLWVFDGKGVRLWPDVGQLLASAAQDVGQELQAPITIPLDFYPLSVLLEKGILFGVEAELLQRRDAGFALFRVVARTALFLPSILQHYLSTSDTPSASYLSTHYQSLSYFSHALEILLHNVLDETVDSPTTSPALLPTVLSFLSAFPTYYLSIIVSCARKTELRSWRTLFAFLPPPLDLFEESLNQGDLKTAGGYLLVLHSLSEMESTSPQVIRLLRRAMEEGMWELCKELARFLMALDEKGDTLREALELVGRPVEEGSVITLRNPGSRVAGTLTKDAAWNGGSRNGLHGDQGLGLANSGLSPLSGGQQQDYFSSTKR